MDITEEIVKQVEDIVDKTYDWDVFSGVVGDFHWRIILTPEGHELNLCHKEKFDRWANSDYESMMTDGLQWFDCRDEIIRLLSV